MTSAMRIAYHSYLSPDQALPAPAKQGNAETVSRRTAFARYLAKSCAVARADAELALVAVRLVREVDQAEPRELPAWVQDGADGLVDRLQAKILEIGVADDPWPDSLEDACQALRLARLLRRDRGIDFILDTVTQHGGARAVQVLLAVPYALARALELAAREGGVC